MKCMHNIPHYLGIDIGGTKIELCTFDADYQLITSKKFPTTEYPIKNIKFIRSIKKIVSDHFQESIKKIGVSFNCVVDKGVVTYSSLLGGPVKYPLAENFSKDFGVPVSLENDVNAMALAENVFGKGNGAQSFVLLNLGTGIRLSYMHNGKLTTGFSNVAGEISQRPMIIPELDNKELILDDFLSGKGIAIIYECLSGIKKPAHEIFLLLDSDTDARQTVDIFISHFTKFLTEISYFYNPELIILNGSLKKSAQHFIPQALQLYRNNTLDFFQFKDILLSEIDHGACLGAVLKE